MLFGWLVTFAREVEVMPEVTMREAITQALQEEMRHQPDLVLLGQDIGAYGGTFGVYRGLFDEFGPDRIRDGPLCESATVGFGIGLAITRHALRGRT